MRAAAVRAVRVSRLAFPSAQASQQLIRRHGVQGGLSLVRRSSTSSGSGASGATATATTTAASSASQRRPSMWFRRWSIGVVSGFVATTAWYSYRDNQLPVSLRSFSSAAGPSSSSSSAAASAGLPSESALRKALVIDNGQLYTARIPDGPIQKSTDDFGRKILAMMTPDQVTERLRRNEESYTVGRGKGVVRYDVVQIPSNDPIEDDHSEKIVTVPSASGEKDDWMFWGIFDGHSGWTTSALLRDALIPFVAKELNNTYTSSSPKLNFPTPASIDAAIKAGFVKLDSEIVHESVKRTLKANSKRAAAELLAPALSGSCALLSFYDSRLKQLRVACTGDSRAVLARKAANGKWDVIPLSVDQTGANEAEANRIRKEHPGEEQVVVQHGRVFGGLEPTRAFGDATYKWSAEVQRKLKAGFFARTPSSYLKTPPYVTAEPVVETVDIKDGDFLVMATDGLWEMLTNEEVVGLVAVWLDKQAALRAKKDTPPSTTSTLSSFFSSSSKDDFSVPASLPVNLPEVPKTDKRGSTTPIRQLQWGLSGSNFTLQDSNVATHVVRNALGGKDGDMVSALLTLPSPFSRRYRDDLTVSVIFFDQQDAKDVDGNVKVNSDATAKRPEGPAPPKKGGEPKL